MKKRFVRLWLVGIFSIIIAFPLISQSGDNKTSVSKTRVNLEHADKLSFNKSINEKAQVLVGDVCFRHDSSYMYCDSAYFYRETNSLEAFSNVRMEQGDTLFVFGDYLFYDGDSQIAYLRNNVRMENGQVTLFTDSLNYERVANVGYYFEGGLIVDSLNQLSSFYGRYYPSTKQSVFNDSVRLENPNFTLYSDTLEYNTESKIATILGPSVIVSDSGTIYTSKGWYNTVENLAILQTRSTVISGTKILEGDSLLYDRQTGYGEAFGNMSLQDTVRKVTLTGEYGYFNEFDDSAFATDRACFLEYSQGDTLFLHADTLRMVTIDSLERRISAYYGVRFYRTDIQGVCDSMYFNTRDSMLYMYTGPVLWNANYQLYGDTIEVHLGDSAIDLSHVKEFAFAVQQVDSICFNQLKGKDLKAYFEGQAVRQIDVSGNAESIYYPMEKDSSMIGLNTTQSGFLSIWLKDRKIDRLKIWPSPKCSMTPIPDLQPQDRTLKDFYWFDYLRPTDKNDIFVVKKRRQQDVPTRSKNNKFAR